MSEPAHPAHWAALQPDTPAIIMAGSGETVSFGQMDQAANRGAHVLRQLGLKRGDVFALWSANNARMLEIAWATNRAGLYMVPIAGKLLAEEAAYIVGDSGARVLIVDSGLPHARDMAERLGDLCPGVEQAFALGGGLAGLARWEDAVAAMPAEPLPDPSAGAAMIYSSGTTGRPKGVWRDLPDAPFDAPNPFAALMAHRYGVSPGGLFVISAPLYHSGPSSIAMAAQCLGAGVLLFEKFDAEAMLEAIARHRPQGGQFVPTMFIRLLKLPPEVRAKYDDSSLKVAIHSAAPCPVEVKRAMIA